MTKKKIGSLVLVLALCLSVLGGCGTKKEGQNESTVTAKSEEAKTTSESTQTFETTTISVYYYASNNQAAEKEVIGAMNAYSEDKIGVTIEFHPFDPSEYADKLNMGLASKEDIDLCWVTGYTDLVSQDALLDLTDLLPEYPALYAVMPEKIWQSIEIKGRRYSVPNYKESFVGYALFTPKDIADKVKEKYGIDFNTIACDSVFEIGNYEEYILACMEEGVSMPLPEGVFLSKFMPSERDYEGLDAPFAVARGSHEITTYYDMPEYEAYIDLMTKWKELGIWKEEQIMSDYVAKDYLVSGSYALTGAPLVPDMANAKKTAYGPEVYVKEITDSYVVSNTAMGSGWAVNKMSQKADACLKWLELLNTDTEFADIFMYGLEGKQYTRNAEGVVEKIADSGWSNGQWRATNYMVPSLLSTEAADKKEQYTIANDAAKASEFMGFRPDYENVESQMAAVSAIVKEYNPMFERGFFGKDKLDEVKEKLKAAGAEEIIKELQSQLDAFFAEK